MKRFFGGKKEAPPPPPSLSDATDTVNKRVGVLDDKIKALDKQLVDFKNQLKATRPGPAQARIKQRAMQVLKQKRMYEQQRDQLGGMAWNMEQASFATENGKAVFTRVDSLSCRCSCAPRYWCRLKPSCSCDCSCSRSCSVSARDTWHLSAWLVCS